MKTVFVDLGSLDRNDLDMSPIENQSSQLTCHQATSAAQLAARLGDADVVITNKVGLNAELLSQLPQLKLVCIAATGTNNVDLLAAKRLGIHVSNCQGYGTGSVVQHAFALMLALTTRLNDYHAAVQRGDWSRSDQFCLLDYPVMELQGKTLGIIGYGELGRKMASIAEAFGMKVLVAARPGTEPKAGRLALEQLLPQVDILTLHCPLTEQTKNLIDAEALALMKPSALLINAARGGIVDEVALASALRSCQLAGAGVDVLSTEPPVNGNPLLAADIPNMIVTPHSAWGSVEARQRIVGQIAENIAAFKAGTTLRQV
ncbi:MAG: 2-hydroxyacid dehydrogenase [Motiliproteus sp.]